MHNNLSWCKTIFHGAQQFFEIQNNFTVHNKLSWYKTIFHSAQQAFEIQNKFSRCTTSFRDYVEQNSVSRCKIKFHDAQQKFGRLVTSAGNFLSCDHTTLCSLPPCFVNTRATQLTMATSLLPTGDEKEVITYYFSKGYEYDAIVHFLAKFHDITMSIRTLKNRLRRYQIRRRTPTYDLNLVREAILRELSGGYRCMWHTLHLHNIQVPRHVVENLMRELDPDGCEQRRSRALQRQRYSSPGPNHTWHVDGYDKLKPFGFPVHGCIDGWSRRIMWLKLTRSNKILRNVPWYLNVCKWRVCHILR